MSQPKQPRSERTQERLLRRGREADPREGPRRRLGAGDRAARRLFGGRLLRALPRTRTRCCARSRSASSGSCCGRVERLADAATLGRRAPIAVIVRACVATSSSRCSASGADLIRRLPAPRPAATRSSWRRAALPRADVAERIASRCSCRGATSCAIPSRALAIELGVQFAFALMLPARRVRRRARGRPCAERSRARRPRSSGTSCALHRRAPQPRRRRP